MCAGTTGRAGTVAVNVKGKHVILTGAAHAAGFLCIGDQPHCAKGTQRQPLWGRHKGLAGSTGTASDMVHRLRSSGSGARLASLTATQGACGPVAAIRTGTEGLPVGSRLRTCWDQITAGLARQCLVGTHCTHGAIAVNTGAAWRALGAASIHQALAVGTADAGTRRDGVDIRRAGLAGTASLGPSRFWVGLFSQVTGDRTADSAL